MKNYITMSSKLCIQIENFLGAVVNKGKHFKLTRSPSHMPEITHSKNKKKFLADILKM